MTQQKINLTSPKIRIFWKIVWSLYFTLMAHVGFTQNNKDHAKNRHRIVFYNVENLFDTKDDSLKRDEEYLPGGLRGWNYHKLNHKFNHIYKTIAALGEWNPPVMVAMCEVENKSVLEDLIQQTPLHRFHYQIVHEESPDERGIDVALLYRADQFEVVAHQAWQVVFPFQLENKTRDLLYVKGVLQNTDTLHVVVNHWPSRMGGAAASEKYRVYAAKVLREKLDSVMTISPKASMIITGDFNDEPEDKSLTVLTGKEDLTNISHNIFPGTLKHEVEWAVFDQFIVSANLLTNTNSFLVKNKEAQVFNPDWLLEKDEKYAGFKPKRTYVGYRYQAGFSDHLPVYIDVMINQQNPEMRGEDLSDE